MLAACSLLASNIRSSHQFFSPQFSNLKSSTPPEFEPDLAQLPLKPEKTHDIFLFTTYTLILLLTPAVKSVTDQKPAVLKVLPGEVLLQCHHLLPALLRLHPLPSLHAQMLFVLQLGIILMDGSPWRSCREEE